MRRESAGFLTAPDRGRYVLFYSTRLRRRPSGFAPVTFKEADSFGEDNQKEEESLCQGDEVQARPDDPILREDAGVAAGEGPALRDRGRNHRRYYRAVRRWQLFL